MISGDTSYTDVDTVAGTGTGLGSKGPTDSQNHLELFRGNTRERKE